MLATGTTAAAEDSGLLLGNRVRDQSIFRLPVSIDPECGGSIDQPAIYGGNRHVRCK